jgi:hypothetical protein
MTRTRAVAACSAVIAVLAAVAGCSPDAAPETPTPSATEAGYALPVLTHPVPEGFEAEGAPATTAGDTTIVDEVFTSAAPECRLVYRTLLMPPQPLGDLEQTTATMNTAATTLFPGAALGEVTSNAHFTAETHEIAAARADLSGAYAGRVQGRVSATTGQGVLVVLACPVGEFPESAWDAALYQLSVAGIDASGW